MRILLVEDDRTLCRTIELTLLAKGFTVESARTDPWYCDARPAVVGRRGGEAWQGESVARVRAEARRMTAPIAT